MFLEQPNRVTWTNTVHVEKMLCDEWVKETNVTAEVGAVRPLEAFDFEFDFES